MDNHQSQISAFRQDIFASISPTSNARRSTAHASNVHIILKQTKKILEGELLPLSHLLSAWGDYVERQIMLFTKYSVFTIEGDFTVHAVWNL